jgi:hypothetical protein
MRSVGTFEEIRSGGRAIQESGDLHEGGFARTRRTHHGDELAGIEGEIDAAEGDDVIAAQPVDFA